MPNRYIISPSRIARYFFHDCERFLRFGSTPHEDREDAGVPFTPHDNSPLTEAILQQGHKWEEQAISTHLSKETVHIAPGSGSLSDRYHNQEDTHRLLRTAKVGEYIYQPTLRAPRSFYTKHGLDPALVSMSRCRPDLLHVVPDPITGQRLIRVIDLKRGEALKAHYAIQILVYALLLEEIIADQGITSARVDMDQGAVWLGQHDTPQLFDLSGVRPHLLQFLHNDLSRILEAPAEDIHWHVYFRCEWCAFFDHCMLEMKRTHDPSMLTMLTSSGKRFLTNEVGARTLTDLDQALGREDADELLAGSASLNGQSHRLRTQIAAFDDNAPLAYGASSALLPRPSSTEISIVLTVQHEPLGKRTWMWGLMARGARRVPPRVLGPNDGPQVFLAPSPDKCQEMRRRFICHLHNILLRVHEHNEGLQWKDQLNLQMYVYTRQERDLLVHELMETLHDRSCSQEAMVLLLHLHGAELMLADQQPTDITTYPLVTLLNVLGRLLALPVPVSYQLPAAISALGSSFRYSHRTSYHHPLGHSLRADLIHIAWQDADPEIIEDLRKQGRHLLWATASLLSSLRDRTYDHLVAYAPKFCLPRVSNISDPLLAKLAFFTLYECHLQAREVRETRTNPLEVQRQLEQVVEVEAIEKNRFRVVTSAIELDEDGFKSYLLVPDTPEGRTAQLTFDDYRHRATFPWFLPKHPHRAIASVQKATSDDLGFTNEVVLQMHKPFSEGKPEPGSRYLLYKRFSNSNSDKLIAFLEELDRRPLGLYRQLLHDPLVAARHSPMDPVMEEIAAQESPRLNLTQSKESAYHTIRHQQITAVWGPPGTGKTHFLAAAILALASAHKQTGKPFRVLVTAFTHAAIENLLKKLVELTSELDFLDQDAAIFKAKAWKGEDQPDKIEVAPKKTLADALSGHKRAVMGATIYATLELDEANFEGFDLVVMDEASQVEVPLAAIPTRLVADNGRLVFAGDHLQLAPIVTGTYPEPEEGAPVLHRSVFEMLLSMIGENSRVVVTLLENFRMNDVLTSYAAKLLYPPEYTCFSTKTASRRAPILLPENTNPLLTTLLDPCYPLTVALVEGFKAPKDSPVEADLVAQMVCLLREHMETDPGQGVYSDDTAFFTKGCFIVSPHHSQIRLIRRGLHQRREWTYPPFVDTVDKMQGQEADVVLVSYGVSDAEFAAMEAEFIYDRNRLNVAITRARSKTVVLLSRELLRATPHIIEDDEVALGLGYMRGLVRTLEEHGEILQFDLESRGEEVRVQVLRTDTPLGPQSPAAEPAVVGTAPDPTVDSFLGGLLTLRGGVEPERFSELVVGLLFLRHLSMAFAARRRRLEEEHTNPTSPDYLDPEGFDDHEEYHEELTEVLEDRDEYTRVGVLWMPEGARWTTIHAKANTPVIGVAVGEAIRLLMSANPSGLEGVVMHTLDALPDANHTVLGRLVELINDHSKPPDPHRSTSAWLKDTLTDLAPSEGDVGTGHITPTEKMARLEARIAQWMVSETPDVPAEP